MMLLFAILFQITYFITLAFYWKEKKRRTQSPYQVLIVGIFILGILVNAITLYEIYAHFALGEDVEFFLGGTILNVVAIQMTTGKSQK